MKFTVDYTQIRTESKYMEAGTHKVVIKSFTFREYKKEFQGEMIPLKNINILLENALGEIVFDTIFQNIEENFETMEATLEYDMKKIQRYSQAVKIPNGTEITSLENWFALCKNRKLEIEVEEKEYNGQIYSRVKKLSPIETEEDLPF